MSPARRRLAAYAALYFFWGTTFLAVRVAVRGLPPFLMSGLRHGGAGLLLLAYARWRGMALPRRGEALGAMAMGALFLGAANGLCAWALRSVESGFATLMIAGVPLVVVAYGALVQGRRTHGLETLLLILGLGGVALMLTPATAGLHAQGRVGLGALVLATLIWAVTMAERPRFAAPASPLLGTAFQMLGGGLFLAAASTALEHPFSFPFESVPAASWSAFAYLVVFGSLVGFGAFSWLLRQDPPHLVGTYAYVNPVVALFAGHLILGEALSKGLVGASVLIVGSVALLLWLRRD